MSAINPNDAHKIKITDNKIIGPATPEGQPAARPESYVRNCVLMPRDGEEVFHVFPDQVLARLDGYAIIPVEDYLRITGQSLPEISDRYLSAP